MILKKIYNVLDKICEPIACLCLALVIILTFCNAVMRYTLDAPIGWTEEISALLYTFMVFFGLSGTHKRNSSVGVDIVVSLLPPKGRRVMDTISVTLTLLLWIVLVYLGCQLAYSTKSSYTSYLRIPYHYIYWFFPISGFFCVVQLLHRLVEIFSGTAYRTDGDGQDETH